MKESSKPSDWLSPLFRYGPLVLWIGVIFYLSGGGGSFSESSRFIRPVLEFLFPGASPETLSFYHGIIRKLAHPTVYGILALLAVKAFYTSNIQHLRNSFAFAGLLLVIVVALLDEFNQSFLPARTGSFWDVLLDSAGGSTAILIAALYLRRRSVAEKGRSSVRPNR